MRVKTLLLTSLLILVTYQDFPLVNYFGEIARTPIIFLAPFFLGYMLLYKKWNISNYTKQFLIYIGYLVLISLIYTVIVVIKNKGVYVLGENILLKNLKMLAYPITCLLVYHFFYNLFYRKHFNFNNLYKAVRYTQLFLLVFLIFEARVYKQLDIFLPYIHSSSEKYWRIRLLTYESSWTGTIVIIFTLLPIFLANYLKKSTSTKFWVITVSTIFFIYYTIHSESKGYLILVLISVLPMLIKWVYQNKAYRKYFYFSLALIFVIGILIYEPLKEEVYKQFNTSITFGTRISGYLASLKTFIENPLGVGLGPYLDVYVSNIHYIVDLDMMQAFNLNEIKEYISSPKYLSSKTYFFDHLVFAGIPFLLFFYLFFIRRYQSISKMPNTYLIKVILAFIILSSISYITFNIKYEVWFFLALADVIEKKRAIETT